MYHRTILLKAISFSFLFLFTYAISAQTLFTYGNRAVSKKEFIRAYSKNASESKSAEKAYRDYLDLYTRFKIKVQAAYDLQLDTLQIQQDELNNFREQIIASYMNDEASLNLLIDEAFERSKKDIHLAHIFIPLPANASLDQVNKARAKMNEAYQQLVKGVPFSSVAIEFSEDPAVKQNNGDIGYITTFILPYELENIAYNTDPEKYSKPIQSKLGFHIIKNLGGRKAVGKVHIAQILLAFPPGSNDQQKSIIRNRADSLYTLISNGADFGLFANQFSNDLFSYQQKGELPAFGVARFDPVFENAAFALPEDSAVSKPLLTAFGYHILKRLDRTPVPDDIKDQEWRDELKQKVQESDRMEVSRKKLVKKIQETTRYKRLPYNDKSLEVFTDSIIQNKAIPELAGLTGNTALFSFDNNKVTVADWQAYLESIRNSPGAEKGYASLMEQFIENRTIRFYRENLEKYNEDFRYQLSEFRDGNLLFEMMQKNIWDAAVEDSAGLHDYYEQHKDKYWWEASADAIIFTASNEMVANDIMQKLDGNVKDWRQMIELNEGKLQADSGRFELSQIPVIDRTNFTPGLITASVKSENDNSMTFAYIIKTYANHQPRSFEDSRGFVINDYQLYLEEKWVDELKKKYPVKINEKVFKSIVRGK